MLNLKKIILTVEEDIGITRREARVLVDEIHRLRNKESQLIEIVVKIVENAVEIICSCAKKIEENNDFQAVNNLYKELYLLEKKMELCENGCPPPYHKFSCEKAGQSITYES